MAAPPAGTPGAGSPSGSPFSPGFVKQRAAELDEAALHRDPSQRVGAGQGGGGGRIKALQRRLLGLDGDDGDGTKRGFSLHHLKSFSRGALWNRSAGKEQTPTAKPASRTPPVSVKNESLQEPILPAPTQLHSQAKSVRFTRKDTAPPAEGDAETVPEQTATPPAQAALGEDESAAEMLAPQSTGGTAASAPPQPSPSPAAKKGRWKPPSGVPPLLPPPDPLRPLAERSCEPQRKRGPCATFCRVLSPRRHPLPFLVAVLCCVAAGAVPIAVVTTSGGGGDQPPVPFPPPPPPSTNNLAVVVTIRIAGAVATLVEAGHLRASGAEVELALAAEGGGNWTPAQGFPNSTAEAAQRLRIASNVSAKAGPHCAAARCGGSGTSCRGPVGELPMVTVLHSSPPRLVVRLGPDSGYQCYTREALELSVQGVSADGLPVRLVVAPDALEMPRSTDGKQERAVGVVAAMSGAAAVGSTAAAGQLARLGAVASAFNCPSEGLAVVSWEHNPITLLGFPNSIGIAGPRGVGAHASAVVGNLIALLALTLMLFLAAGLPQVLLPRGVSWGVVHTEKASWTPKKLVKILAARRPRSLGQSLALVGFPSRLAPVAAFLCPGAALTGITLLVNAPGFVWRLLGAGSACLFVVGGGGIAVWVARRGGELSFGLTDCVRQGPRRGCCRRFWLSDFDWWCWLEPTFVQRCKLWFHDYGPSAPWFLAVELAVSGVYGASNALRPDSLKGCRTRTWVMTAVACAHFCMIMGLRPYRRIVEQSVHSIISALTMAALILTLINQHQDGREHWSMRTAGSVATVIVWVITAKCAADLVVAVLEPLERMGIIGGGTPSDDSDNEGYSSSAQSSQHRAQGPPQQRFRRRSLASPQIEVSPCPWEGPRGLSQTARSGRRGSRRSSAPALGLSDPSATYTGAPSITLHSDGGEMSDTSHRRRRSVAQRARRGSRRGSTATPRAGATPDPDPQRLLQFPSGSLELVPESKSPRLGSAETTPLRRPGGRGSGGTRQSYAPPRRPSVPAVPCGRGARRTSLPGAAVGQGPGVGWVQTPGGWRQTSTELVGAAPRTPVSPVAGVSI
eukprot:TRINITY_DN28834_c0_g1_i2.p1 TRINITY_DN28834_c0_g1~~TRINITY_DN28834_c0_g1_i2.p1  ORF type:complete len:1077 (+),score=164.22 TRINITY_DN28834_c0_g1_i2:78-3308(+)